VTNLDPDTIHTIRIYWDIGQTLLLAAIGAHQYLIARDRVRREQLAHLERTVDERVDDHANRITRVEAALTHVPRVDAYQATHQRIARLETARESGPGKADIERLHSRIDGVAEGLSAVKGELHGMARLLGTIDQYLRDHPHRSD
jgi:hypothetical protein